MRMEARRRDDGRGPYAWRPVVRTPRGLALGGIYDKFPADLTDAEIAEATLHFTRARFEWREAAA